MEKYSPFLIAGYVNIMGGLCLVPFAFVEGSFHEIFLLNLNEWAAVLCLALFCSLLGYFIWFYVIGKVRAAVASSFMFAEPLVTVLLAITFIGEEIGFFVVTGGLLIFIGVYLVSTK